MNIELSKYHPNLKIERRAKERYIFDPVRKDYFIVQPEELVRQSWIQYIIHEQNISPSSLSVEKQIKVNTSFKRFDMLLYQKAMPLILFEFKSFKSKIDQSVCDQIASYNYALKVPFLVVSNGLEHHIFKVDFEHSRIEELNSFPDLD